MSSSLANGMTKVAGDQQSTNGGGLTFAGQASLPKLPIPPLADTMKRYLRALEALQTTKEHERTKKAVKAFLETPEEGPRLQAALEKYNKGVGSYVEEFWYESYLTHTESVVLHLNPFFMLEDNITPTKSSQLERASSLITSSLAFIHDLRNDLLQPDVIRGAALDMSQMLRLFGTSRIPTANGCTMSTCEDSRHVVVVRRGQFYWFDTLDNKSRPILTEREILKNLEAIVSDADKTEIGSVAAGAVGVLSTEGRRTWAHLRTKLTKNKMNADCLRVIDTALFVVCLDDSKPESMKELCETLLCGTYKLEGGVQVGTCTNRWYDKLQIIVTGTGAAGINFEHTGVDGHTVLRFAADVYTELVLLFAKSINPLTPSLFKAKLSPHARSYRPPKSLSTSKFTTIDEGEGDEEIDAVPKKLIWNLTRDIQMGIRFAETRLGDLICQNDIQALEFKGFGGEFIKRSGFSPDAFVQMTFQAAYFALYGRIESTYEPAMTKAFLHGRTEAIRTVQPESAEFAKLFCSDETPEVKIDALRKACKRHSALTKDCSQGLGQDRHLYALYCLLQREIAASSSEDPDSSDNSSDSSVEPPKLPALFKDPGFNLLNTSILSTSNCGNPALRLFGFGPVTELGYGIGYIIKEEGISICASSKHLQTDRFLSTLESVMLELQKMLKYLYLQANKPMESFVDHSSVYIAHSDPHTPAEDEKTPGDIQFGGYGYFTVEDLGTIGNRRRRAGRDLKVSDY